MTARTQPPVNSFWKRKDVNVMDFSA